MQQPKQTDGAAKHERDLAFAKQDMTEGRSWRTEREQEGLIQRLDRTASAASMPEWSSIIACLVQHNTT